MFRTIAAKRNKYGKDDRPLCPRCGKPLTEPAPGDYWECYCGWVGDKKKE